MPRMDDVVTNNEISGSNVIINAMKYLSMKHRDLWRHAYWFNFDLDTYTTHIKSVTTPEYADSNIWEGVCDIYMKTVDANTWDVRIVNTVEYKGTVDVEI